MTSLPERDREPVVTSGPRGLAKYCAELLAIGAAYFLLAKAGLLLASIHPSATPVWPAAGLALAAILLRGVRVWPAIFAASLTANATNEIANAGLEGQLLASLGIAIGNTLEAVVSGQLITIWSGRARTFENPERRREIRSALSCTGYGDQRDPRCRQPGARSIRRARAISRHRVHLVARERGRRTGRYAGDRPVDHGPISAIRFRPVSRIDEQSSLARSRSASSPSAR